MIDRPSLFRATLVLSALLCLCQAAFADDEARLIGDLVPDGPNGSSLPASALESVTLRGSIVFVATDSRAGTELWWSDGSSAGTRLVHDLRPGTEGSEPTGLAVFRDEVYFVADDGAIGRELWVTDGTGRGTRPVDDICPGPCDGIRDPAPTLQPVGDLLYFAANDGVGGSELWRTDGTAAGTERALDLCVGACDSCPSRLVATRDRLFFVAGRAADSVAELWSTDGTPEGTHRLSLSAIRSACVYDSSFHGLAAGDRLFFQASDDEHGTELWTSRGTPVSTRRLTDRCAGPCAGVGELRAVLGERVVFSSPPAEQPPALLVADAAGEVEGLLGGPRAALSAFPALGVFAGELFIAAQRERAFQKPSFELWKSDGTEAGTERVTTLLEGVDGAIAPGSFAAAGDRFYLALPTSRGRAAQSALWVSRGTAAGTELVTRLTVAEGRIGQLRGTITDLVGAGARVFFAGRLQAEGDELWASDGTEAGTGLLLDIHRDPGSSRPRRTTPPAAVGTLVVFEADTGEGPSLFRSDGTAEGTSRLELGPRQAGELFPYAGGLLYSDPRYGQSGLWWTDGDAVVLLADGVHNARSFAVTEGAIFFAAGGPDGVELWRSDGTQEGTRQVADIHTGFEIIPAPILPPVEPRSSSPAELVPCPPGVLFAASDERGREPWFSDGTEEGTIQLADLCPGSCNSEPTEVTLVGGLAVFAATSPETGRELWVSDATVEGTRLLVDLVPGPESSYPRLISPRGSQAFFFAATEAGSDALWRTDGTPSGTAVVAALDLPGGETRAVEVAASGRRLFFTAFHPTTGVELWVSDTTADGTRIVRELRIGPFGGYPTELLPVPEGVLFSADGEDGAGRELWVSDGTAEGTLRVTDLAPAAAGSQPEGLAALADRRFRLRVFFRADDGQLGSEPYVLDADNLLQRPRRQLRMK